MSDFKFKPFEQMTSEDYEHIGFKSGLEIHQQLLTEKKLFCRCPAGKYSSEFDAEILRHMRPTLSELGEYDGTALMEFKTKKNIIYRIKRETVCTYEMDDTPPFLINETALDIAIQIGLQFGCNIVDELHIARKQYLDGSIPTGFQRTAIFALNGKIPYKDRKIDIVQMSIEEDSCREQSDIGHERVYLTDRLGMPLIETVTAPQMRTPQEVAEVATICARVAQSSNKVRRGMGAAREDVNVSVAGGTRVEIKGVARIPLIPILTYNEAMRQWNLLRLRDELHRRGINERTFYCYHKNVTQRLRKIHYLPVKKAIESGLQVQAVILKGFADLLHWQTQTDTFFSQEISDRVRVIACLTTMPNIIHSDSKGETFNSADWKHLRRITGAKWEDTIVLVWGNSQDTEVAVREIAIRAKEATVGVPSETRQALRDGTNGFERILPGADRMYPDTDLPPQKLTEERIAKLRCACPKPFWDLCKYYQKLKIPPDTIMELATSELSNLFAKAVEEWKLAPGLVAVVLIQFPKRIKKMGIAYRRIDNLLAKILASYRDQQISIDGILPILITSITGGHFPQVLPKQLSHQELEKIVEHEIECFDTSQLRNKNKLFEVLTANIMNKYRLRIPGHTVTQILKKKIT